jgi:hypothetical protein
LLRVSARAVFQDAGFSLRPVMRGPYLRGISHGHHANLGFAAFVRHHRVVIGAKRQREGEPLIVA